MNYKFYDMRIAQIHEASSRIRWVFAAISIASVSVVGASWNYMPFGIYNLARALWKNGDFAADPVTKELQLELLKGWVQSSFVNIQLLGIRFSITSAAIIGSLAMVVLMIWQFYASRRENHLIGGLLRDVEKEHSARMRSYVFHGILGTQVFATVTDNDAPVDTLQGDHSWTDRTVRQIASLLAYLPAAAILFVIFTDFMSVFWLDAPFRANHKPLISEISQIMASEKRGEFIRFILTFGAFESIAAAGLLICVVLARRIMSYQRATVKLLRTVARDNWGAILRGKHAESD